MPTKITQPAKKAGAEAFSKALGKTLAETVEDDALFSLLGELWDCASMDALRSHVERVQPTYV